MVGGVGRAAGDLYKPVSLIVPTVAFPPALPSTNHFTDPPVTPFASVTVAENWVESPVRTSAVARGDHDAGLRRMRGSIAGKAAASGKQKSEGKDQQGTDDPGSHIQCRFRHGAPRLRESGFRRRQEGVTRTTFAGKLRMPCLLELPSVGRDYGRGFSYNRYPEASWNSQHRVSARGYE